MEDIFSIEELEILTFLTIYLFIPVHTGAKISALVLDHNN